MENKYEDRISKIESENAMMKSIMMVLSSKVEKLHNDLIISHLCELDPDSYANLEKSIIKIKNVLKERHI